jgi:hypothetical protein
MNRIVGACLFAVSSAPHAQGRVQERLCGRRGCAGHQSGRSGSGVAVSSQRWSVDKGRQGWASPCPPVSVSLEGDATSQANLAIARDTLLLVAAEQMPEVRVGRKLRGIGGVDRQDLGLMARGSGCRLINREAE